MKKKILGWALLLIGAWCGVAGFLGMRSDSYKQEAAFGGFYGNDTHATVTKAFVWAAVLVIAGIIVLLMKGKAKQSSSANSFCSSCGTAVYASQKFCQSCGKQVMFQPGVQATKAIKQESSYIRNLMVPQSLLQKVASFLLIAMYGLMSYQYLSSDATGASHSKSSYDFALNFQFFGLPDSWGSLFPKTEGGYWFLLSALAFIVFFGALFTRKIKISATSLMMIFISAHVLQLIFFIMLYQGSSERSLFDVAIPVIVGLSGIALFALLYWALLNPVDPSHLKSVALLAIIVAALFIVHDLITIYIVYSDYQQEVSYAGHSRYDDFSEYFSDRYSAIRSLPFFLIRCGFVLFYYNIYASLKKASLPQRESIQQMEATHGN